MTDLINIVAFSLCNLIRHVVAPPNPGPTRMDSAHGPGNSKNRLKKKKNYVGKYIGPARFDPMSSSYVTGFISV